MYTSEEFIEYLEEHLTGSGRAWKPEVTRTATPENYIVTLIRKEDDIRLQDLDESDENKQSVHREWFRLAKEHLGPTVTEFALGKLKIKHYRKGLSISVYKNMEIPADCTNNGISAQFDRLILVGPGIDEVFEIDDTTPGVMIEHRTKDYKCLRQYMPGIRYKQSGPMMGGNFASTSDSRFPNNYPLPIHDRYE